MPDSRGLKTQLQTLMRLGHDFVVKSAPKEAATFDRMIIVYGRSKYIYQVIFYNKKTKAVRNFA